MGSSWTPKPMPTRKSEPVGSTPDLVGCIFGSCKVWETAIPWAELAYTLPARRAAEPRSPPPSPSPQAAGIPGPD